MNEGHLVKYGLVWWDIIDQWAVSIYEKNESIIEDYVLTKMRQRIANL